jgi:hypothetical protein
VFEERERGGGRIFGLRERKCQEAGEDNIIRSFKTCTLHLILFA